MEKKTNPHYFLPTRSVGFKETLNSQTQILCKFVFFNFIIHYDKIVMSIVEEYKWNNLHV